MAIEVKKARLGIIGWLVILLTSLFAAAKLFVPQNFQGPWFSFNPFELSVFAPVLYLVYLIGGILLGIGLFFLGAIIWQAIAGAFWRRNMSRRAARDIAAGAKARKAREEATRQAVSK